MAKKRRKEKEKEVFRRPEFDEVEFMKKEITNTKIAIITIVFAIPIGVVSYLITLVNLPVFAFLVGVASIFLLRYVYGLSHIDTTKFEKKDWLGNGAMFFFTWLAVWVLILNMPFTDLTNPTIKDIRVDGCDRIPGTSKDYTCPLGTNSSKDVRITARVTDNSGIQSVRIYVTSSSNTDIYLMQRSAARGEYFHIQNVERGSYYSFEIEAEDNNGHVRKVSGYSIRGD